MNNILKFSDFLNEKVSKKTKGTPATLYINDDSKTVDKLDDFEFESDTLNGIKKELKAMSKELHKDYLSQRDDEDEDNDWWYQGHFTLNGEKYDIEGTEITKAK